MNESCDTCEYACLLGEGALYCDKHEETREDYNFIACEEYKED